MPNRKILWRQALLVVTAVLLLTNIWGCARDQGPVYYSFTDDFGANSYIFANGSEAVVIDTAAPEKIIAALREKRLEPKYIVLTHGHFDHISGVNELRRDFPGAEVRVHPGDMHRLDNPEANLSKLFGVKISISVETRPLKEKSSLKLDGRNLKVIETPGHSEGSICLQAGDLLFTGDTLFKGAVGRTDFPGSSPQDLESSLQKLFRLPGDMVILPGHGESSTIGEEKRALE